MLAAGPGHHQAAILGHSTSQLTSTFEAFEWLLSRLKSGRVDGDKGAL